MTPLRILFSRMLDLLFSGRRERRLEHEIGTHLDMLTEQYEAAGMTPEEARHAARRAFGGVDQIKEEYRDQRGLPLLDALGQDVRFAWRTMRRHPGFSVTAVLVLGLGIGVNNMLFTILNAHTLRGLPIPRSGRVVFVTTIDKAGAARGLSFADYRELGGAMSHVEELAAFRPTPMVLAGDGHTAERFDGAFVTANAFEIIGARPVLGRAFTASDDMPGAAPVALVTRAAWEARYGADPAAMGRVITVNGIAATLVGVMPDRSGFPSTVAVWMPLWQAPGLAAQARDNRTLQVFGRLPDGIQLNEAVAESRAVGERLAAEHPETNRDVRINAAPINDRFLGRASDGVWRAFMLVGCIVVLISCANVANLMLDRSVLRARELAIRASVGGSRLRLVRQLLVEGAVIGASGALVGLLFAMAAVRVFRRAIPADALPYWYDYTVDWRVLAALIAVAVLTVFVFALVPAVQASRTDVVAILKDGGRSGPAGRRRMLASAFLAAQVALAVVLLAHFAVTLRDGGPGLSSDHIFDRPEIVTAAVSLPSAAYPTTAVRAAFYDRLLTRLRGVAGLEAAALASAPPLGGGEPAAISLEGSPGTGDADKRTALVIAVTADYFRVLGLPLLQGRQLEDADGGPGREVAIVNEPFAETFLGDDRAVGRRIALGPAPDAGAHTKWLTIVGMAPSIRHGRGEAGPVVYVPFSASAPGDVTLMVNSALDTATVVSTLRQQVQALDADLPIFRARTMPQARRDLDWNGRLSRGLFTFLTLVAVLLATIGLYAVTAHCVSQDRKEIGVRMALGARPWQIIGRVIKGVLLRTALGFGAGIVCTALWGRTFPSGSEGVRATDVVPMAVVAGILLGVVLLAAIVPSRRASRVDPLVALRVD